MLYFEGTETIFRRIDKAITMRIKSILVCTGKCALVKRFFLVITGILILISGIPGCTSPAMPVSKPAPAPAPTAKPPPAPSPRSPQVKSIKPNIGLVDGGTDVLISGSNFGTTVSVKFGGSAALNVRVLSDTEVQARTPPHQSATVDVVVTNPDGVTGTLPYGFTYLPKRVSTPRLTPTPTRASPNPTVPTPTPVMVTLQVTVMPSGYGSVTLNPPGGTYARDTEVTLTATPASPNYGFITWGGNLLEAKNPITIIMDANKSISAHFVYIGS